MRFTLTIDMDGAAFGDTEGEADQGEIGRILCKLGVRMVTSAEQGDPPFVAGEVNGGVLADLNGNTCGTWAVTAQ